MNEAILKLREAYGQDPESIEYRKKYNENNPIAEFIPNPFITDYLKRVLEVYKTK